MKKLRNLLLTSITFLLIISCAGQQINTEECLNLGADLAFVEVLKNNPDRAEQVITILEGIKLFASNEVTYDDLGAEIAKYIDSDYALEATLISDYLLSESPIIDSINIFDGYRDEFINKVDRLIKLAKLI